MGSFSRCRLSKIHRATAAIDVGLAVNPLNILSKSKGLVFRLIQLMAKGAITPAAVELQPRE